MQIDVNSEIGTLRCVMIHSPDSGLGKVVPSKAQDWLFEDIVHLDAMRRNEYDYYVKLLLYFLDPEKIKGKLAHIDSKESDRNFFKPDHEEFQNSRLVIEIESLLAEILRDGETCRKLVSSVCAIESCTYRLQQKLIDSPPTELAKIIISGALSNDEMIFAPIPNLIFSRDIGIAINGYILLNKAAKKARSRETLIARYIFFNHPLFASQRDKVLEIHEIVHYFLRPGDEPAEKTTLEGGDVMVVSPGHVVIGCSERTSVSGANQAMKLLFEHEVVEKVTIVKIPQKRDYMHIDTIFTQVKRDVWVLLGSLAALEDADAETDVVKWFTGKKAKEKTEIVQFCRHKPRPRFFKHLEELLCDISENELKSGKQTRFIYSGNDTFPFDAREQWTDSCNLLALREGVVLGYDRNDKTVEAFRQNGFATLPVAEVLAQFERGELEPEKMEDTLILMPSSELSRARGGFHCMSLPLLRDKIN